MGEIPGTQAHLTREGYWVRQQLEACWGLGLVLGRELVYVVHLQATALHSALSALTPCPSCSSLANALVCQSALSSVSGQREATTQSWKFMNYRPWGMWGKSCLYRPDVRCMTSDISAVNYLHLYPVSTAAWVASPKATGLSPGRNETKCNLQQQQNNCICSD